MKAKLTTLAKQLTLAAAMGGLSCAAAAHDLTLAECVEGGDFIMHAAMSRENGMTREAFLERMESDIRLIQAFPPQLRWFVQDEDDEQLLTWAARLVFDSPRAREPSVGVPGSVHRTFERHHRSARRLRGHEACRRGREPRGKLTRHGPLAPSQLAPEGARAGSAHGCTSHPAELTYTKRWSGASGRTDCAKPNSGGLFTMDVKLTRRQFFKVCATGMAGSSLAALGFAPTAALAEVREFKLLRTTETRNTCTYCSVGCGIIMYSLGDKAKNAKADIIHIEGDADHPVNRGTLCPKGAALLDFVHSPNRLKYPEYRAAGSSEWKRISWDDAFTRIARLMKDDRDKNFEAKNKDGATVNRWLSTGFLAASASSNETGYLTHKVVRSLGILGFDNQARV